jgi:hypothetical protein
VKRKRKVFYPPPRNQKGPAPAGAPVAFVPTTVVSIDLRAGVGRKDVAVGSRVKILGGGLYAGEVAIVERLISGGIPAALVRTEAGRTRRVRTIDLEPVTTSHPEPATVARPEPAAARGPEPAAE